MRLEELEDFASIAADRVLQCHHRQRAQVVRLPLTLVLAVGMGEQQDAAPAVGELANEREGLVVIGCGQDLGRPQVEAATVDEVRRGPLACRTERRDLVGDPAIGGIVGRDDRFECGVGARVGRAERAQRIADEHGIDAVERMHTAVADLAGRDRAGLVQAQRVDPGEQLDRCEFLREGLPSSE